MKVEFINENDTYITESVFQWDLNQELEITGMDLDTAPIVHFSNRKSTEAILVQASLYKGTVLCPIPNILLKDPYSIIAIIGSAENQKLTSTYRIEIPIRSRVMPEDYYMTQNVPILTYEAILADTHREVANARADMISFLASEETERANEDAKERSERINEDTSLRQNIDGVAERIDMIIAQSGTSSTEVVASRTNARSGKTYIDMANRLDNEYADSRFIPENMLSGLASIYDLPVTSWSKGGFKTTDGSEATANYLIRTPFIYITKDVPLKFNGKKSDGMYVIGAMAYFYNENKAFISRNNTFAIPEGTKYVRFTFGFSSSSGIDVETYGINKLLQYWSIETPNIANRLNSVEDSIKEEIVARKIFDNIGCLFSVAETYLKQAYNRTDRIKYKSKVGMYMDSVIDDYGEKCMSCSQFISALLTGVDYQHSRYVGKSNEKRPWGMGYGYGSWLKHGDYMTADETARYFIERGSFKPIKFLMADPEDEENIIPWDGNAEHPVLNQYIQPKLGDLLFIHNGEKWSHIALCCGIGKNKFYILHCGDTGSHADGKPRIGDEVPVGVYFHQLSFTSSFCPTAYVSSSDLIDKVVETKADVVLNDKTARHQEFNTSTSYVTRYEFSGADKLEEAIYTVKCRDDGDNSYDYIKVYYMDADGNLPTEPEKYTENVEMVRNADHNMAVFFAQLPIYQIELRVKGKDSGISSYDISNFSLYKGYNGADY